MPTVFSHIVQKRLSQESENVATTALEFILGYSEAAQKGMMKLLRGVIPDMPPLWFRTQQTTEGGSRPDMCGYDGEAKPHVFIENKFWAGLTKNQPVFYLDRLAEQDHPTLLLVVVPEAREETVWRVLSQKLEDEKFTSIVRENPVWIVHSIKTNRGPVLANRGPILALTSWDKLLSFLQVETIYDDAAKNDLLQLRALCEQEDTDAPVPFSAEEITDQRIPSLILQLTSVVEEVIKLGLEKRILSTGQRLPRSAGPTRIGIYASILAERRCELWFGVHFGLWKKHGATPVWGLFSTSNWGRATEVRALLEPWAAARHNFVASEPNGEFAVAFDLAVGKERNQVIRGIVDQLQEIASVLSDLKPRATGDSGGMGTLSVDLIPSEPTTL